MIIPLFSHCDRINSVQVAPFAMQAHDLSTYAGSATQRTMTRSQVAISKSV
jgi:hypothetical protein